MRLDPQVGRCAFTDLYPWTPPLFVLQDGTPVRGLMFNPGGKNAQLPLKDV